MSQLPAPERAQLGAGPGQPSRSSAVASSDLPGSASVAEPSPNRSEQVRRALAPLVALLSSSLALLCVLNLADMVTQVDELADVDARVGGWAGAGGMASLVVTTVAVLVSPRLGAGLPLAVGAAAAVLGLALGRSVIDDRQLALALVMLGVGVGGLLGGSACMAVDVPGRWHSAVLAAYCLPLVAGPALVGWLALHSVTGDDPRLSLHPPVEPLAALTTVVVGWSVLSLLREPPQQPAMSRPAWDSAWASLVGAVAVPTLAVMLLGFEPDVPLVWLRPLVLVTCAVAVIGLALTAFAVPTAATRVGFVAAVAIVLCWPPCVALLLVAADAGPTRVSPLAVAVLVSAAVCGAGLGSWRPGVGVVGGLVVVAVAAAGAWVMPANPWLMVASGAPMAAGAGGALLGGLRRVAGDRAGVRFVGAATVCTLVLGSLIALPLSWALEGSVPDAEEEARNAARVMLGLTFGLTVLAAAFTSTLLRRIH